LVRHRGRLVQFEATRSNAGTRHSAPKITVGARFEFCFSGGMGSCYGSSGTAAGSAMRLKIGT
jgi:hypothetical protein